MKKFISIVVLAIVIPAKCQVFEDDSLKTIIKVCADHIYNSDADSATFYIDLVEEQLPEHPVVPLMRAMTLLWANIPTITADLFLQMQDQLNYSIELAEAIDPDLEDPEMVFFAMAAHGLLAEYYADQSFKLRAVGEANKAYGLMKKGFKIVDTHPEFLFTTGLYNYFREKYPEKHPIYKPLLWFFRGGDIELGLEQLEQACTVSVLTQVEAYVYLSYIYLRYEYRPDKAQAYLDTLVTKYPNNFYAKGKYLESLANATDFYKAPATMLFQLMTHQNPYYKLAGFVFLGYYNETVIGNMEKAEYAYRKGLEYGERLEHHGEYFKGLGYVGLGRILVENGKTKEAKPNLNLALKFAETDQIRNDAKSLLSEL